MPNYRSNYRVNDISLKINHLTARTGSEGRQSTFFHRFLKKPHIEGHNTRRPPDVSPLWHRRDRRQMVSRVPRQRTPEQPQGCKRHKMRRDPAIDITQLTTRISRPISRVALEIHEVLPFAGLEAFPEFFRPQHGLGMLDDTAELAVQPGSTGNQIVSQ